MSKKIDWITGCENQAKSLTKEKRQEFLDYMFAGKNLGEAADLSGITRDAATGVININLVKKIQLTLNRESI